MKNERQANAAMSDTLAGRADGPIGHRYAECNADACGQGRRPCPTPEACQVRMFDVETERPWLTTLLAAVFLVGTIALSAIFSGQFAGWWQQIMEVLP